MQKYDIETIRLGLRIYKSDDIDYLAELRSDPDVLQFFPGGIQNREQAAARLNDFISYYKDKGLPGFVMFERESGEFVGSCGFGPVDTGEIEVGYLLHKKFWGQGYASEALVALLE